MYNFIICKQTVATLTLRISSFVFNFLLLHLFIPNFFVVNKKYLEKYKIVTVWKKLLQIGRASEKKPWKRLIWQKMSKWTKRVPWNYLRKEQCLYFWMYRLALNSVCNIQVLYVLFYFDQLIIFPTLAYQVLIWTRGIRERNLKELKWFHLVCILCTTGKS